MSLVRTHRTILPSAARTATATSATFTDVMVQSARFYLNITAASGTGGLTFKLLAVDILSGATIQINKSPTAVIATGLQVYDFALSAAVDASLTTQAATSRLLPYQWQVSVVAGDASSYTYSVSMETAA